MPVSLAPTYNIADIFGQPEKDIAAQKVMANLAEAKSRKLSESQIKTVSQDFEAVFLAQMLQALVPEEGDEGSLFNDKEGDEIFRGMMMEQYAKEIAKSGGIGIASYIERELRGEHQAAAQKPSYQLSIGAYQQQLENANEITPSKGETL